MDIASKLKVVLDKKDKKDLEDYRHKVNKKLLSNGVLSKGRASGLLS